MKIATYNFLGDELNKPILIEKLVYQTHYDYSKPHRHNYNEIFFFTKGKGKHMIDFKTHTIKSNSIHFVSSNKVHKVKRDKKSFGYVLMFKNDFLTQYNKEIDLFFLFECEKINLGKVLFSEIKEYLGRIEIEIISDKNLNYKIISTYLQIILLKLKQFIQENCDEKLQNKSNDKFYRNFYFKLENNFLQQRKTEYYANVMNVNIQTLNRKIKKSTGKTVSKLIKERLLLEIKRLMLNFSLSFKEIAIILNFSDQSNFSKFILKETKLNPSEYRKTLKIYQEKV